MNTNSLIQESFEAHRKSASLAIETPDEGMISNGMSKLPNIAATNKPIRRMENSAKRLIRFGKAAISNLPNEPKNSPNALIPNYFLTKNGPHSSAGIETLR